jgi:hypothetical protein
MAGCTGRSRRKPISKWERESMFRATSVVRKELFVCLCVPVAHSVYASTDCHVILPY